MSRTFQQLEDTHMTPDEMEEVCHCDCCGEETYNEADFGEVLCDDCYEGMSEDHEDGLREERSYEDDEYRVPYGKCWA